MDIESKDIAVEIVEEPSVLTVNDYDKTIENLMKGFYYLFLALLVLVILKYLDFGFATISLDLMITFVFFILMFLNSRLKKNKKDEFNKEEVGNDGQNEQFNQ